MSGNNGQMGGLTVGEDDGGENGAIGCGTSVGA